ncbi:hypothetical protein GCM10009193_03750 [Shewanella aestuarii]|nr:hypothetical protein GCM10009193_03750 [Shewanella aestuarii]
MFVMSFVSSNAEILKRLRPNIGRKNKIININTLNQMITIIIRKVRPTLPHIYWLSLGFVVKTATHHIIYECLG